jgi:hypothetical protein
VRDMRAVVKEVERIFAMVGDDVLAGDEDVVPGAKQILHEFGVALLKLGIVVCKLMDLLLQPMASSLQ